MPFGAEPVRDCLVNFPEETKKPGQKMKLALSAIFAIVSVASFCTITAAIASYVYDSLPAERRLDVDEKPLWTSVPKRIDVAEQDYVRLPPRRQTAVAAVENQEPMEQEPVVATLDTMTTGAIGPGDGTMIGADEREPMNRSEAQIAARRMLQAERQAERERRARHVGWCHAHYNSYDPYSDTYRAYSGQVRPCDSPYAPAGVAGTAGDEGPRIAETVSNGRHVAWCFDHYRSYDPDTDTFQPYDGPRKRCDSPFDSGSGVVALN